jgi:hypothetical protein
MPSYPDPATFARYAAERDAVLSVEDIEAMRAHLIKYGNERARTADEETLRVGWHNARTGALTLPVAERQKSVDWLAERGFTHFATDLTAGSAGSGFRGASGKTQN